LNDATARQIEAEDIMKEEGDFNNGIMTEAEMTYLAAMEEVKNISHDLVIAEKLVAKYEALLVKFDNESASVVPSSIVTASSYYTDYTDYTSSSHEERERDMLARRAQRAELRAELAAREAMMAKQTARKVREDKEKEIHRLQEQLHELQSESSAAITEREHSVVLARAITAKNQGRISQSGGNGKISQSKLEDVKQRFRNRSAGRNGVTATSKQGTSARANPTNPRRDPSTQERMNMFRAVGEEMFQHLDFYERSLKAVEEKS